MSLGSAVEILYKAYSCSSPILNIEGAIYLLLVEKLQRIKMENIYILLLFKTRNWQFFTHIPHHFNLDRS